MSRKLIVMPGDIFGSNKIVKEESRKVYKSGRINRRFLCVCTCGTQTVVTLSNLRSGHGSRCRKCGREESRLQRITHGMTVGNLRHHLYRVHGAMLERCYNENNNGYMRYGGRGITVCDEWRNSFQLFYDWSMSHGWQEGLQIDRIDNDGNYTPENCRFVTSKMNNRNRQNNHLLTLDGKTICIAEWEESLGMLRGTVSMRLKRGWSIRKTLSTPVHRNKSYTYNGKTFSATELAELAGIPRGTLITRIARGWSIKRALTTPVHERCCDEC